MPCFPSSLILFRHLTSLCFKSLLVTQRLILIYRWSTKISVYNLVLSLLVTSWELRERERATVNIYFYIEFSLVLGGDRRTISLRFMILVWFRFNVPLFSGKRLLSLTIQKDFFIYLPVLNLTVSNLSSRTLLNTSLCCEKTQITAGIYSDKCNLSLGN